MSEIWKTVVVLFYLQTQTWAAHNVSTTVDKRIRSSIETRGQPCEDFYIYACGNYSEKANLNASVKNKNLFDHANHEFNLAIINILGKPNRQEHQIEQKCVALTGQVRNYFEACRKVAKLNLTRYLEELQPGPHLNWPALDKESNQTSKWHHEQDCDVFHLLGTLRSLDIAEVMFTSLDIFYKNEHITAIQPLKLNYSNNLPTQAAVLLSALEIENSTAIVEDVFETHIVLQNLLLDYGKPMHSFVKITFGELVRRHPNLNFSSYFVAYRGEQLPSNSPIWLYNPSFFRELNDKMWLLFDKSKLCNYLMIHYLMLFHTPTQFSDQVCVNELRKMFNLAVNFLYYHHNRDYLENNVKPDVTEMYETVTDVLVKYLESHDLGLTVYQIESLKSRLASVRLNVGNLPDNATCATVGKIYASVPALDANNYYKNHLIMTRFLRPRMYENYFQTSSTSTMLSLTVIMSEGSQQLITLNYASLMPPVYDFHYNQLDKYSLLGLMLAQKLLQFCKLEKLNDDKESEFSKPLQTALECLEVVPQHHVTYPRIRDTVSSEVIRRIVTLKFLNQQPLESVTAWKTHFFLRIAQLYCTTDNERHTSGDRESDRLNRIAMNTEGFSQAFSCPQGSNMTAREKCII